MSAIAIITARGGSKRIPRKNIKDFCGEPIIAYSIEAAINSGVFDEVMVSTDSEEIKVIAEKYGAQVPFYRSEVNSNDYATTANVISEVLDKYKNKGRVFDIFACIYPTAPFLTGYKLKEAMRMIVSVDAVISVVKYSYPPQRAFVIRNGHIEYQFPEYELKRSQDLEPIYHDCGQFYFCKTDKFLCYKSLILPKTKPYIISEEEAQDIDTLSDWHIAEKKYQLQKMEG